MNSKTTVLIAAANAHQRVGVVGGSSTSFKAFFERVKFRLVFAGISVDVHVGLIARVGETHDAGGADVGLPGIRRRECALDCNKFEYKSEN